MTAMTPYTATAPASWRLFLALWPEVATLGELLGWRSSIDWPAAAKLVAPERMHLTLHFIGGVPQQRVQDLAQGLAVDAGEIELELDALEVWNGDVAVLTTARVPEPLTRLHERLAVALERLDLPPDARTYRPHVTLARRAMGVAPMADRPLAVRWRSTGYVLARSVSGRYDQVERFG